MIEPYVMTLGELIVALESHDQDRVIPLGFNNPHSYRGYYDELAFEPAENVTVGAMLKDAKSALGKTFTGYKGGDYTMNEHTDVHLSFHGHCGETLGKVFLNLLLNYSSPIFAQDKTENSEPGVDMSEIEDSESSINRRHDANH
ncbi:hypothetical protein KAR91_21170 [Candidatus Pacearchaeota archaeon]|nr:hypothetical protein [Candidatus Pacearchaeota archaeon]